MRERIPQDRSLQPWRIAACALVLCACSPVVTDYWAGLDDAGTDPGGDLDSDSDSDTSGECAADGNTCGDAGDTDTTPAWDGSVDGGDFCGNPEYAIFLSGTGIDFDNAGAPHLGNAASPEIVLTGFSFFGCPHCAHASTMLEEIFADPAYSTRVVYYFGHFPFGDPVDSMWNPHRAAEAADEQGRFWEMHHAIFAWLLEYGEPTGDDLFNMAEGLGLDMDEFAADYPSAAIEDYIAADKAEAEAAGVTGTPTFFINGVRLPDWSDTKDVFDCLLGYSTWEPDAGASP
jgi:hypothetical protein